MNDEPYKKHPSYGMVSFSRIGNGSGRRLFGSSLDTHHSSIRLRIAEGAWKHDLHRDWYTSERAFVEVEMSPAQFAELITTMNKAEGVPCTIVSRDGKSVAEAPHLATEVNRIKDTFRESLEANVKRTREYRKQVEELASKLPESRKKEIKIALDVMEQALSSNIPFIMESFNEASAKVVTAAKQEIDAFTTHAIRSAGLKAIADNDGVVELPSGDD